MDKRSFLALLLALALAACTSVPRAPTPVPQAERASTERGREVVFYALSLLDTGYRFGGKNPEAGLDCSGMVSYIFRQAANLNVSGSAADIAQHGRPVDAATLTPGDLVFFNTQNRPFSHVGIYIGDGRFVHAPSSSSGRVRIDKLSNSYFSPRFESARSYFD
ncbi:MAG: C40 family peptidase [Zoogloeaceae bacterium]|nr:C40 family peptidase [Zoogloeaceae bacterium]